MVKNHTVAPDLGVAGDEDAMQVMRKAWLGCELCSVTDVGPVAMEIEVANCAHEPAGDAAVALREHSGSESPEPSGHPHQEQGEILKHRLLSNDAGQHTLIPALAEMTLERLDQVVVLIDDVIGRESDQVVVGIDANHQFTRLHRSPVEAFMRACRRS
jgi:hypothetical protein